MNARLNQFFPVQRLLLATDLRAQSDRALERSIQLAQTWQAKLDVVTVVDGPQAPDQVFAWLERGDAGNEAVRSRVHKDFTQAGLAYSLHMTRGDVAAAVYDSAAALRSQCVITGTAQTDTLGQRLFGSTAQRLSHRLTQPLLAVRNRVYGLYERIVIATDFSATTYHLVETVMRLFPGRDLALYHACPSPFAGITDNPRTLHSAAYRNAVATSDRLLAGSLSPMSLRTQLRLVIEEQPLDVGLGSYVRRHDVELVVAGTRAGTGLRTALLGTASDRLLQAMPCDTLLVPLMQPTAAG